MLNANYKLKTKWYSDATQLTDAGLLELGDIIEIKAAVVQYYVIYVGMDAEIGHLVAYRPKDARRRTDLKTSPAEFFLGGRRSTSIFAGSGSQNDNGSLNSGYLRDIRQLQLLDEYQKDQMSGPRFMSPVIKRERLSRLAKGCLIRVNNEKDKYCLPREPQHIASRALSKIGQSSLILDLAGQSFSRWCRYGMVIKGKIALIIVPAGTVIGGMIAGTMGSGIGLLVGFVMVFGCLSSVTNVTRQSKQTRKSRKQLIKEKHERRSNKKAMKQTENLIEDDSTDNSNELLCKQMHSENPQLCEILCTDPNAANIPHIHVCKHVCPGIAFEVT